MSKTVDMTKGSITKHIVSFALPLLLTNLGQQLYMIVDAAIVGRGVGVSALAAVGATDWCYWLILWTVMGFTQGFATFISRYFGDKNYKAVNKTIAMSAVLSLIIGAILTVVGIIAARPLLNLLNTPGDIIDGATVYLITMISGTLIVTAYNMAGSILRAFGDGKTPLAAMIIAGVLNILLDSLFVFLFKWGIFGAAIASVTAQLVSFIFCIVRIRKIDCINLERSVWKLDGKMIKDMLMFGIPVSVQYIIIAVGGILLQSSVNAQGSIFIAGYTATNKVYGLLECSATSLGLACSTFFAQNYGAKLYDRVKRGVKIATGIVVGMAVVVFTTVLFTKRYLLQLFLDVNEPGGYEALDIAVHYLTIMMTFIVILYLIHIFRNALQAMEIAVWSLISGIAECSCRVFMAKVAINWAFLGSDALFLSEPVAWLGALLSVMLPYFYYRRKLLNAKGEIKNHK